VTIHRFNSIPFSSPNQLVDSIVIISCGWNDLDNQFFFPYCTYLLLIVSGIYVREGYVINFTRMWVDKMCSDCFQREGEKLHCLHSYAYGLPLLRFMLIRWGTCMILPDTKSPQEVINKARELHKGDGFGEYALFNNNCEHFALFCRTDA